MPGQPYSFKIKAWNKLGYSEMSDEAVIKTNEEGLSLFLNTYTTVFAMH